MNPLQALLEQAPGLLPSGPDELLWPRLDWLDRLDRDLAEDDISPPAVTLRQQQERISGQVDSLYSVLREDIREGNRDRLAALFDSYLAREGVEPAEAEGFDALDELLGGLLQLPVPGIAQVTLTPDMVAYQPTPARHVLDLLRRAQPGASDVLVDLGAGLGQVPMLAVLASPARALGIEIEPSLVASARQAAAALGLDRAAFRCQDLREADLSAGTLFYLYTPLRGALLDRLLERLHAESAQRPLRIAAFGPCVDVLQALPWLQPQGVARRHRITLFTPRA